MRTYSLEDFMYDTITLFTPLFVIVLFIDLILGTLWLYRVVVEMYL